MADELLTLKRLFCVTVIKMIREASAAGERNPREYLLDLHTDPVKRVNILHHKLGTVEGQVSYGQWLAVVDHAVAIEKV